MATWVPVRLPLPMVVEVAAIPADAAAERATEVARGHLGYLLQDFLRCIDSEGAESALLVGEGGAEESRDLRRGERIETEEMAAAEQRRDDVEPGVMRRAADEPDHAGFDVRAHGVLESMETYSSALDLMRALHGSGVTGSPRLSPGELRNLIRDYDRLHRKGDAVVGAIRPGQLPDAGLRCTVNGAPRQEARLSDMIWTPAAIIAALSRRTPDRLLKVGRAVNIGVIVAL